MSGVFTAKGNSNSKMEKKQKDSKKPEKQDIDIPTVTKTEIDPKKWQKKLDDDMVFAQDRSASVAGVAAATGTTRYPLTLQENFPGIKYCISYGSSVYPREQNATTPVMIPNSEEQMVDLLFVISETAIPEMHPFVTLKPGTSTCIHLPLSNGTLAEWHATNMIKNTHHYHVPERDWFPDLLARLSHTPRHPCIYFPLIKLNPVKGQTRPLYCKYGVVAEKMLIDDLTNWSSFHLAGRLQKPFLTMDRRRDVPDAPEAAHRPASSLEKAVHINRLNAIKTAMLLLPERFTCKQLLETITNLSYRGDVRMAIAEPFGKVAKMVQSQALMMAHIYLSEILSATELTSPRSSSPPLPGSSSSSSSSSSSESIPVATASASSSSSPLLVVESSPASLDVSKHLEDVVKQLEMFHMTLASQARDRVFEMNGSSNLLQPWTSEMDDVQKALLSNSFIFQQDKSEAGGAALFEKLPSSFKHRATECAASLRVGRLFSPFSLMSTKQYQKPFGKPDPFEAKPISRSLMELNVKGSLAAIGRAIQFSGKWRSLRYVGIKIRNRINRA